MVVIYLQTMTSVTNSIEVMKYNNNDDD